ncbi:MAG TPA: Gfo/Idh/MocA family oxidoreductase, partial [Phenylobacterium sp.]|nr:Gfo/Idh/MocA family oxidoreductase [Phenylobacterium sp.]
MTAYDAVDGSRLGPSGITRRGMLGAAAGTAALLAGPAFAARKLSASDRVNIAVIGAGGQGASNMSKLTSQNIVATADVDYDHVLHALVDKTGWISPSKEPLKAAYDKAARYTDYRKMFDAQKDIDAVLIATPDHHHAVAARWAMERGYHVFVQKPLTYNITESRKLASLAAANPNMITQMGNQGHSGDDGRRVIELIRGGVIGPVHEVHVWTNRPVWPQGVQKPAAVGAPGSLD